MGPYFAGGTLVANADRECLSDLNHQLRSSLNYSGMFFAACVAFRSGQWAAARHYGDRALTMLKREDIFADCASEAEFDRHELLYFMALVTRFSLNDYSEFNKARALLEETFQYHVRCGDAFGLMRAKSELAALFLVLLFKRILFGDMAGRFNWGDRNVYFSQAVDLLREARDLLGMSAQKNSCFVNNFNFYASLCKYRQCCYLSAPFGTLRGAPFKR
jgi:hypothetical protein